MHRADARRLLSGACPEVALAEGWASVISMSESISKDAAGTVDPCERGDSEGDDTGPEFRLSRSWGAAVGLMFEVLSPFGRGKWWKFSEKRKLCLAVGKARKGSVLAFWSV